MRHLMLHTVESPEPLKVLFILLTGAILMVFGGVQKRTARPSSLLPLPWEPPPHWFFCGGPIFWGGFGRVAWLLSHAPHPPAAPTPPPIRLHPPVAF